MAPQQVTLPVLVAPVTPWAAAETRGASVASTPASRPAAVEPGTAAASSPAAGPPTALFAPGKAPVPVRRPDTATNAGRSVATAIAPLPPTQPQGWADTYIRACETAFDSMSNLGNRSEGWRAWRARHIGAGEGTDFGDFIAERARAATYRDSAELASELGARRAGGLYRFDPADARRVACLLFTADGLAQVFIAGPALDGLRDEVIARLDGQTGRTDLANFALTREAERYALTMSRPACGIYCRIFGERLLVQRRFWLDETSRVLIAAKRYATASGLASVFSDASGRELVDGLPDSFIVYSDLARRARILQNLTGFTGAAEAAAAPTVPMSATVSAVVLSRSP